MCFVLDLNFFPNDIRFFSATSGCGGMGAKFSYPDFRMAASSPKDAPIHNPCPRCSHSRKACWGLRDTGFIKHCKRKTSVNSEFPYPGFRMTAPPPHCEQKEYIFPRPEKEEVTYFAVQGIKYLDLMENYFSSAQFQIITYDWLSSV